jgi:hypothetical protein
MSRAQVWGSLFTVLVVLGLAAPAAAQPLTRIHRGTWELGTDQSIMLGYTESTADGGGSVSELRTTWSGGLTPRYFVLDNLALAFRMSAFYAGTHTEADYAIAPLPAVSGSSTTWAAGFQGVFLVNYYARVAPGWFFKPGLGVGFYAGRYEEPGTSGAVTTAGLRADIAGGAVLWDLGFAWYASRSFTMRAGLEILVRAGRLMPDNSALFDDRDTTTVDFGFVVGGAWSK